MKNDPAGPPPTGGGGGVPPPPIVVQVVPKLAYTLDEAEAATGISRSCFYSEHAAHRIAFKKRGSTTLILTEELARYLAALPDMETRQ